MEKTPGFRLCLQTKKAGEQEAVMNKNNQSQSNDKWIYRISVVVLGLVVLTSVIGTIVLSMGSRSIPDAVIALGSAAIGSLAGLLVPSPLNRR